MKDKLIALVIALFLLVPALASADAVFILKNTSDKVRVVKLYWIDHPHDFEGQFLIAGAELKPGESFETSKPYPPGVYYAEWGFPTVDSPDKGHLVNVGKKSSVIQMAPDGVKLLKWGMNI
jgi:hypothetical protein